MGVPISEAEGDHPTLLSCGDCGKRYETDETMSNECPHCGHLIFEVEDTDPSAPWRQ